MAITVNLDPTGTFAQVRDNGTENQVYPDPHGEPQIVKFRLIGRAAGGKFIPPIVWLPGGDPVPPPRGRFGDISEISGSTWGTLSDVHTGPGTRGVWVYELTIEVGGQRYTTRVTPAKKPKQQKKSRKPPPTPAANPNIRNN